MVVINTEDKHFPEKITHLYPFQYPSKCPHPDDWKYENPDESLQEMSQPRKEVERQLTKYEDSLFTHLLKIFYYREFEQYLRGLIVTVHKCAFKLPKVKATKGKKDYRLPRLDIYELLWNGDYGDCFQPMHDGTLKDFNCKSHPDYAYLPYVHKGGDIDNAESFMKAYYNWVAKNLAVKDIITYNDVKDEVEELLNKYPYRRY